MVFGVVVVEWVVQVVFRALGIAGFGYFVFFSILEWGVISQVGPTFCRFSIGERVSSKVVSVRFVIVFFFVIRMVFFGGNFIVLYLLGSVRLLVSRGVTIVEVLRELCNYQVRFSVWGVNC